MKKAGIITIFKSENMGGVLQACALRSVVERLGYEAQIIDYVDKKRKQRKMSRPKRLAHNLWYDVVKRKLLRDKKWRRVCDFVAKHDKLSGQSYTSSTQLHRDPPQYDIYITGSDQVWNPAITGADEAFYLTFAPVEAVRFSYGASLGNVSVLEREPEKLRYMLGQLDAISVREADAAAAISKLTGREVRQVLDPTLLLGAADWAEYTRERKPLVNGKYILCYYLPGDPAVESGISAVANRLSKESGLKVVSIGKKGLHRLKCNKNDIFGHGPLEFLWLLEHAECVVTNSFHGTAFSVNFRKPVYIPMVTQQSGAAVRTSRITSLLSALGLEERIVPIDASGTVRGELASIEVDYARVHGELDRLRQESLRFLQDSCRTEKER